MALSLRAGDLVLEILSLQPPFVDNLVEVTASLLDDGGVGVVALSLGAEIIKFGLGAGLGFLQRGNLLLEGGDGVLSLCKPAGHLGLVFVNLLTTSNALSLVASLPQLDVGKGL